MDDGTEEEMRSRRMWVLPALGIAVLAYFVGGLIAPILYPYKMYLSDTSAEIAVLQLRSLTRPETYFGPYALQGYVGLIAIFAIAYFLFKLRHPYLLAAYFFLVGIYYDAMINGAEVGHAHAAFDETVGAALPVLTRMPFYVVFPLLLMVGLPLFLAFALSKLEPRIGKGSPPQPAAADS